MKYLCVILTIIALLFIAAIYEFNSLDESAKRINDNSQAVIISNQALINANARLEGEIVNLRKEVSAIKESFPKR
jgi:hypothetical protein